MRLSEYKPKPVACHPSMTFEEPKEEQATEAPRTLEDFRSLDHYPAVRGGELLLVTAEGDPATDPAILAAWETAKAEIQAQLEDRHRALLAWAEALLSKHGRVYLTTPDDVTQEQETSERVDGPEHLAAELLRCEACGMRAQVRTAGGKRHSPTLEALEGEAAA